MSGGLPISMVPWVWGFIVLLPDGQGRCGEDLATWYRERSLMHIALKVWDALQTDDIMTLERWFSSTTGEQFLWASFSLMTLGLLSSILNHPFTSPVTSCRANSGIWR
jgi:hypothetical protein